MAAYYYRRAGKRSRKHRSIVFQWVPTHPLPPMVTGEFVADTAEIGKIRPIGQVTDGAPV
jgi:hypothetical protein